MLPRIPLLLLAVGNCHVKALLEPTAVPTHADVRFPPLLTGSPTHADVWVPPLPTGSPTRLDVWDTSAPTHPLPTSTPAMSAETSPPSTHPSYSWSTRSPFDMGKGKGGKSGTRSSTRGPGKGNGGKGGKGNKGGYGGSTKSPKSSTKSPNSMGSIGRSSSAVASGASALATHVVLDAFLATVAFMALVWHDL